MKSSTYIRQWWRLWIRSNLMPQSFREQCVVLRSSTQCLRSSPSCLSVEQQAVAFVHENACSVFARGNLFIVRHAQPPRPKRSGYAREHKPQFQVLTVLVIPATVVTCERNSDNDNAPGSEMETPLTHSTHYENVLQCGLVPGHAFNESRGADTLTCAG